MNGEIPALAQQERRAIDVQLSNGLRALGAQVARELERARHCCPHCEHWQQAEEVCGLYRQRPPARVIAFGCPSFSMDEIPF